MARRRNSLENCQSQRSARLSMSPFRICELVLSDSASDSPLLFSNMIAACLRRLRVARNKSFTSPRRVSTHRPISMPTESCPQVPSFEVLCRSTTCPPNPATSFAQLHSRKPIQKLNGKSTVRNIFSAAHPALTSSCAWRRKKLIV